MIKIFFNDRLLAVTDQWDQCASDANAIGCKITKKSDIPPFVRYFLEHDQATVYFVADDPQEALSAIRALFTCREAAGGLVRNTDGDVLMIFRHNRWDLPKGHCEPGESPEETALREVAEECGLHSLQWQAPLADSYHLYQDAGQWVMKHTRWFTMDDRSGAPTVPQTAEGITRVEWIPLRRLPAFLDAAYASVRDVVMQSGLVDALNDAGA
ncbi:MAG: NUDIX domain-containing protein [Prevotellaceae bacterium]|jgi:ADP-ribose pyrophosphatase YjhB (NUDIX family)|nr:NUDIX domain-containing protein [Prevotellaceae bacterium]